MAGRLRAREPGGRYAALDAQDAQDGSSLGHRVTDRDCPLDVWSSALIVLGATADTGAVDDAGTKIEDTFTLALAQVFDETTKPADFPGNSGRDSTRQHQPTPSRQTPLFRTNNLRRFSM
jgi:hypothetical protein